VTYIFRLSIPGFSNYLIGKDESTKKQSKLQNSDNNTQPEFKS